MSTSKFVSRLSSRLQPIALKFNKKSISSLQSSTPLLVSVSSRRLSRPSRLPLQLSCVGSMMPLHSATALSRLISSLSTESDSWALVPQGISMPL
ncbi:hypothetical protein K2173_023672 [Erythroxylum novogranatense]|uniref:Uncharacterized protein n=1 Tax=Erythroxylum novogranatense TaxID=1862640 RepID=A0AAV8TSK2_9ROSI|nr:hypothetical protein K2173_023672 [Erythroxylum novogranatense]